MKREKRLQALYWLLAALPLIAAAVAFSRMPAEIQVTAENSVASGREQVFIMPAINAVFAVAFNLAAGRMNRSIRERSRVPGGPPDTAFVFWALKCYMMAFLSAMCLCVVYGYYAMDAGNLTTDLMGRSASLLLGAGTAVFAMRLPRATKTSILALRWRYTERSDQVWFAVHRLGRILLYAAGACMVVVAAALSGGRAVVTSVLILALVLVTLYLYSKRLYEDEFLG